MEAIKSLAVGMLVIAAVGTTGKLVHSLLVFLGMRSMDALMSMILLPTGLLSVYVLGSALRFVYSIRDDLRVAERELK